MRVLPGARPRDDHQRSWPPPPPPADRGRGRPAAIRPVRGGRFLIVRLARWRPPPARCPLVAGALAGGSACRGRRAAGLRGAAVPHGRSRRVCRWHRRLASRPRRGSGTVAGGRTGSRWEVEQGSRRGQLLGAHQPDHAVLAVVAGLRDHLAAPQPGDRLPEQAATGPAEVGQVGLTSGCRSSGPKVATSRSTSAMTFLLCGPSREISPMISGSETRLRNPAVAGGLVARRPVGQFGSRGAARPSSVAYRSPGRSRSAAWFGWARSRMPHLRCPSRW